MTSCVSTDTTISEKENETSKPISEQVGRGELTLCRLHGLHALSHLSFTYPLKLIAPKPSRACQPVYMLSYGGGLVGGDQIVLKSRIEQGATLALLTQGSTKVFKARKALSSTPVVSTGTATQVDAMARQGQTTSQSLHVHIGAKAILLLLPDPVQPFADARYVQQQHFHLADTTSSCIVLDWLLGGRVANGEVWQFDHYRSTNTLTLTQDQAQAPSAAFIDKEAGSRERLLIRDAQILDCKRDIARQMGRRHCMATLLLAGPETTNASAALLARFKAEDRIMGFKASSNLKDASSLSQWKEAADEAVLWTVAQHRGVTVLKCAGGYGSSEAVKRFLNDIVDRAGWRAKFGRDAFRAVE